MIIKKSRGTQIKYFILCFRIVNWGDMTFGDTVVAIFSIL